MFTRMGRGRCRCNCGIRDICAHLGIERTVFKNFKCTVFTFQIAIKTNKPITLYPRGTFIYKLFDKKYWQATILGFDTHKGYNNEEELTPEEVVLYLKPPKKGEFWTENQSG